MKTFISILLFAMTASAWGQCSPIVVDTRRDGIELGPAGRTVSFDVNADGFRDSVQWVRRGGDEAFLSLDRNRNGLVDDGSELFGVGTPLVEGGKAPNGFVGLAQYDQPLLGGNDDGVISLADAIWPELTLWLDSNADGVASRNEMRRPESFGLTSFGIIPKVRRYTDPAGNSLPYWAWASTTGRPARTAMVDVYFLVLGASRLTAQAPENDGTAHAPRLAALRASSQCRVSASPRPSTERLATSAAPSCRVSSTQACRGERRSVAAADADRRESLAC
jgi:hypothetical protein